MMNSQRDSFRPTTTTTQAQTMSVFGAKSQFESQINEPKHENPSIQTHTIIEQRFTKQKSNTKAGNSKKENKRYLIAEDDVQGENLRESQQSLEAQYREQFPQPEQRPFNSQFQGQSLLPIQEECTSPTPIVKKKNQNIPISSGELSMFQEHQFSIVKHQDVLDKYEINRPYLGRQKKEKKCGCFFINRNNNLNKKLIDSDQLEYQKTRYVSMSYEKFQEGNPEHLGIIYTLNYLLTDRDKISKRQFQELTDELKDIFQLQQLLACMQLYPQYFKLVAFMNHISTFLLDLLKNNKLDSLNERFGKCYDSLRQLQMGFLFVILEQQAKDTTFELAPMLEKLTILVKQSHKQYQIYIQQFTDFLDNKIMPNHLQNII